MNVTHLNQNIISSQEDGLLYKNQQSFKLTPNPHLAKLIYLNFHPLEIVSRYRDPQLQVSENYSWLFNLSNAICNFDV